MPSISVRPLGLSDPPPLPHAKVHMHLTTPEWTMYVLNGGMSSGEPSIMVTVEGPDGLVVVETSLICLLAAARTARAMAEVQFGWTMPP